MILHGRSFLAKAISHGSIRRALGAGLLYLVVFEAALFGSGRILQIGPLTLKMVLFSLTLLYTIWSFLSLDRVRFTTVLLTTAFLALLLFGLVNGLCHDAPTKILGQDISPLLAFLVLPFFELTICGRRQLAVVFHIFVFAASIMAVGYIAIMFLLWFRLVPFAALYDSISVAGGEDFVFEGDTGRFLYKGAIFICIALIFLLFQRGRWSKALASLLLLSLFAIGSRGLFSALALSALLYVQVGPMPAVKKISFGCILILLAAVTLPALFSMAGDKTESNMVRLKTISQVSDRVNAASAIFGHGFGIGVPERPDHMEITYLEIFQKQGIIGLMWWMSLFAILAIRFRRALSQGNKSLVYPLFLSATFIAFESATNPFLNNPIGMYPFIISFVGLGVLARDESNCHRQRTANEYVV